MQINNQTETTKVHSMPHKASILTFTEPRLMQMLNDMTNLSYVHNWNFPNIVHSN